MRVGTRVFFYAGGDATPGSAGAISTPNALIQLGGGEHIFQDLPEDYTSVSWEAVIEADPECVLVKNGSNAGTRGADLTEFLETSPITAASSRWRTIASSSSTRTTSPLVR